MDQAKQFLDFVLHFDEFLGQAIELFGPWTYLLLFVIIFAETGLVVTPFLPGDSLLFAAGAFAALKPDVLNIWVMATLLTVAAIVGDTVNYWIGAWVGPRAFSGRIWLLKKSYLDKAAAFYEKYGGKAIILARFVPIIRTFAPFVAGIGRMNYSRFIFYNITGGIVWVFLFTLLGYYFGTIPWVQKNFEVVVIAIILQSVVPIVWEVAMARFYHKPTAPVEPS